ncbi:putative U4/U6 small nuclear ribonucleoprotein Prp3-like [Capsicum annuum]|nr:putative U4/U6 small nuclear ribonucleoprotein Prp3-like [Capsicum annuum]
MKNLSYEEIPVEILNHQVRRLRNKEVSLVKVLWRNQSVEGATWEAEADMQTKYPHLFSLNSDLAEGAHDIDYAEDQENYGIEEENEVDAVNLDEDDENIGETPAVGNANVRSESVNCPPRPPRAPKARTPTSIAWEFFTRIEGETKVQCNICQQVYEHKRGGNQGSTGAGGGLRSLLDLRYPLWLGPGLDRDKDSRAGQFFRLNPSNFTSSKVEKDPQDNVDMGANKVPIASSCTPIPKSVIFGFDTGQNHLYALATRQDSETSPNIVIGKAIVVVDALSRFHGELISRGGGEHKNANKQKESSGDITIVYIKAEDEIFHEIASNKKVTHKVQNSRFPENNLPSSSGGTMVNHGQINKSEDSRSSDGEEFYDLECMVDLKEPLLKACCQKDVVSKLRLFLRDQAKDVDLFVSQRVVNLPP